MSEEKQIREGTFRPLLPTRKGEAYAWGIVALLSATAIITHLIISSIPWPFWVLYGFFLFAALLTTFSNWVDRRTVLTIAPDKLEFQNGLRSVSLPWEKVAEVTVHSDRWGKRVQVRGDDGQHFAFRTVAQIEIHEGEKQDLFGFREGEALIETIVQKAGLTPQEENTGESKYTRNPR